VIESDESKFSINDLVVYIASLGALYFLFKLIIQLFSLARIHWYSKPSQWREFLFRNVIFPITPFSFFNKVYIHKEQHQELELNDIFKHEYVHVRGHHSIDVLWFEIVLLICWYNPFVWLMRKSVRQNLEFLTDQQVLDKGVDRQAYQYSLLNVTKQGAQVGISNQFNFKTLKKRIMMMNKKRSSKLELSKYVFLLPILIITGITFTVNQAEAKIETVVINMENTDLKQQIKEVFVQKQVDSTKPQQKKDEIIKVKIQNVKADSSVLDSIRTINIKEYADHVGTGVKSENGQRASKSVNMVRLSSIDNLNQPLIILDGERMPEKFRLDALKPELIESFSVLNGKDAEKYGKGSENGVLVIDLKKESMDSKLKNLSEVGEVVVTGRKIEDKTRGKVVGITFKKDSLKEKSRLNPVVDIKAIPENAEYYIDDQKVSANDFKKVNPNKIESVVVRKDNETPLVKINTIKFVEENKTTDPQVFIPQKNELIVIDGKPSTFKEFKKLKKEEIESMSKIDNEGSRAIYGPKAKNGVVLITTKKK
jgi:hypothetical protein